MCKVAFHHHTRVIARVRGVGARGERTLATFLTGEAPFSAALKLATPEYAPFFLVGIGEPMRMPPRTASRTRRLMREPVLVLAPWHLQKTPKTRQRMGKTVTYMIGNHSFNTVKRLSSPKTVA